MPDKKQNPLIGAFRDPTPGVPPGPPASGEKKPFEPVQITMEVAPAGAVPQVKSPEPSKTEATPPKAADATPVEKAAEGKNPVGEPKTAANSKLPAADKTTETQSKEADKPPKDDKDGKPAAPKEATAASKPIEPQGKEADKLPKNSKDGQPIAPKGATTAGKPAETQGKDADKPPKDNKDGKPAAPKETPAADKPPEVQGKDADKPPKDSKDGKPAAPKEPPAADKPAETQGKEADKSPKDGKDGKPTAPKEATTADKPTEAQDKGPDKSPKEGKGANSSQSPDGTQYRFIALSKIHDLPGTYVKDTPRKDYSDLINSMKREGVKEAVILRRREDGEYQLVDGFHRIQAAKKAGMLEIKADVYEMTLKEASEYRRARHSDKPLPIPGKLIPPDDPSKAVKETTQESGKDKADEPEIPADFKLPLTREGQSEIITTLKVSEIHPFEGHPFNVKDDKDMMDLVDSIKKFGVLEPVVVIPRKAGGYEMVSGHRRRRACELAGIATMPVIVRQLDRDEAVISMVDANLKRENISPMEKARAYAMKLEAMKHKAGRRTKEETAALEAAGKKPMRADEELAQQTGESRSNIQKLVRLNNLNPELQQMVEDKTLPVHTAADLSYLKKEEQAAVADAIQKEDKVPTGAQAVELKKASQEGKLTKEKIEQAVAPTKREETPPLKITLMEEDLRPYFPDKRTTIPDVKRGVLEALDLRKKALERQKAKAQADKGPKKKVEPEPSR